MDPNNPSFVFGSSVENLFGESNDDPLLLNDVLSFMGDGQLKSDPDAQFTNFGNSDASATMSPPNFSVVPPPPLVNSHPMMKSEGTIEESPATLFTHGVLQGSSGNNATSSNMLTSGGNSASASTSQQVSFFGAEGDYSFGDALRRSSGSPAHSPFMCQNNEPSPVSAHLKQVNDLHLAQKDQLEKIRAVQRQLLMNPQQTSFAILVQEEDELRNKIQQEMESLMQLEQAHVMSPLELAQSDYLTSELHVQHVQVQLFLQELRQLGEAAAGGPPPEPCIATLVITEQPFTCVLTKGKTLDESEPVAVQLLSGAGTQFANFSSVSTQIVYEQQQSKSGGRVFQRDQEAMDPSTRIATFRFKVVGGTRKMPVRAKFAVQAQVGAHAVAIDSEPTKPFIVITNEIQYEESALVLLRKAAFSHDDSGESAWAPLANQLQRAFLRGTRQDLVQPTRALSLRELTFIHRKFFGGAPTIDIKALDLFWKWFGKTLQKLRYQRHVTSMWQAGLIYGFIERDHVQRIIAEQEVGACLIRFSENHPGFFAVGYKIAEDDPALSVRHYLVTAEDIGTKKTLPDFLGESNQFKYLCQLSGKDDASGEPQFKFVPKDLVLEPWYTRRQTMSVNGYDTELTSGMAGEQQAKRANVGSKRNR